MSEATRRVEVSCRSCGATLLFEKTERSVRCPYCDSPSVVDRPATPDRPDPVFALGFAISRDDATARMRRWIQGRKMAPFGLKKKTAENVRGIYLPTYLYSASTHTTWAASIAEHYRDEDRHRQTEYRDLDGLHATYVADILVTASRGIPNDEVEGIEPFDLGALQHYTPAVVSGWMAEEPSLTRDECRELARAEARGRVDRLLRGFLPGDGVRSLRHQTVLRDEATDLTLVPVWVFAIRYHEEKPPIRVLVNGQTGWAFGKVPFSWAKLGLLALGAVALIGLLRLIAWLVR
jgi:hypothetical protein